MFKKTGKLKFLVFIFIHFSIQCYSQQTKYTFSFKDADLKDVVKEVSRQAKINILYNPIILRTTVKINGDFKNVTVTQALDTFFHNTQIAYKLFKKDIVLFKKNEEIKETHQIIRPVYSPKNATEKPRAFFTDTITYSIVTHDTVVTTLTDYVKIQVKDTVKVYDTIEVIRKIIKPVTDYRPKAKSFVVGISMAQGLLLPTFKSPNQSNGFEATLKSSLSGKGSRSIALNFMYQNKNFLIESGIGLVTNNYLFNYKVLEPGYIMYTDTIDKYYTTISQSDTTWVYITQERKIETTNEKRFSSDLQYRYLSIPLLVGYPMIRKNLTLEFKAGFLFNYYLGSKGFYLNAKDSVISVDNTKAPDAWLKVGVLGAFACDYFLNEKVHVYAQSFASWDALPIRKKNTSQYATNFNIGFQIGIRYFF